MQSAYEYKWYSKAIELAQCVQGQKPEYVGYELLERVRKGEASLGEMIMFLHDGMDLAQPANVKSMASTGDKMGLAQPAKQEKVNTHWFMSMDEVRRLQQCDPYPTKERTIFIRTIAGNMVAIPASIMRQ